MTAGRYLNGIDVGTGGVSAGIFDSDCSPFSFSSAKLQIHHPHLGWAEQDPDEWWSALSTAVAIHASVGARIYGYLQTAVKSMVWFDRTIEPDADRHGQYRFWLQRDRDLDGGVRDVQHEVVGQLSGGKGDASDG